MAALKKHDFAVVLRVAMAIFILIVTVLMLFSLTSCSTYSSEKTIYIGISDSYPPMEYRNDKNDAIGFDVDFANEIGKRLGMRIVFVWTPWSDILQALRSDKFDCIISAVSITPERQNEFVFTKPYMANAQVIVTRPANTSIKELKDLKDKKVGCQKDTTANDSCDEYLQEMPFELTTYEKIIMPFADLKSDKIDAIVVDEVVASYYASADPESYKIAVRGLTNEPIGICFRKGDESLRDKMQKVIDGMKTDGTLKRFSEKWIGKDLTSNIDESSGQ